MRLVRAGGAAAVLVAVSVGSHAAVPLYDGVGFPDQPYRYVRPPAGAKDHRPPRSELAVTAPVSAGRNAQDLTVQSDEQGPQILVDVGAGAVHAAPGAHTVTFTAMPLAPDSAPRGATVDGNVYRLGFGSDAGDARFAAPPDLLPMIYLRAPAIGPVVPVMAYRPRAGAGWTDLPTSRTGNDVFAAAFRGPGDYAMVQQRSGVGHRTGNPWTLIGIVIGVFLLSVGVLAVITRGPWRQATAQPPSFREL